LDLTKAQLVRRTGNRPYEKGEQDKLALPARLWGWPVTRRPVIKQSGSSRVRRTD